MSNELEFLSNKINNCNNFKNDDLKKEFVDFVGSLGTSRHKFGSYLRLLDDLRTQLTNKELDCLISVLSEAIKVDNVEIRKNSIEALGVLEKLADRTVPQLVQLMKNEKVDEVRGQIADTLANIGSTDSQQILKLIKYIEDPYPLTQKGVIIALSKLREDAAPAIPKLQKVLHSNNSNAEVTAAAISCLGEIGQKASDAVPHICNYLKLDKDKELRRAAAQSLTRIGKILEDAVGDLIDGMKFREESDLRIACAQALGKVSIGKDKAILELVKYLSDEDLQIEVIEALAQINSVMSAKFLFEVLLKGDRDLVVEKLHKMAPDGFWQTKSSIILDMINQEPLTAHTYSNYALHLFHAMLPPSEWRITQEQNSLDVSELCQILIGRAVKDKSNTKLLLVIAALISQGSRLGPKGAQLQIENYMFSHNIPAEDFNYLRAEAGDTTVFEKKLAQLEDVSLKEQVDALQKQVENILSDIAIQYNRTSFRADLIFFLGVMVAFLSFSYIFYSLVYTEKVDFIKSVLSGGGFLTGCITAYTYFVIKPQKLTEEATDNLLYYKGAIIGFAQELRFTVEKVRSESQSTSSLDDIQKRAALIRNASENLLKKLEEYKGFKSQL